MNCISPLSLKRGDERVTVPCGRCNFCLERKRGEWTFRIKQELKVCESAYFLTLTYSDEFVPKVGNELTLRKADVQKFMKRLRKINEGLRPLRYYTVGEYGTRTNRPHYHSIMFNLTQPAMMRLQEVWKHGGVYAGTVTGASIHYVTKYHLNRHAGWSDGKFETREKPFLLSQIGPVVSASPTLLAALSGIEMDSTTT